MDAATLARVKRAILERDVVAVQEALRGGVDANSVVYHEMLNMPLLVLAASVGEWNTVRVLLDAGADLHMQAWRESQSMFHDDDTIREDWGDAMQHAINGDHVDVVELLLHRGCSADDAVGRAKGRMRVLRFLLECGANPNGKHVGACISNGSLAHGDLDSLRLYLEYGADPNQRGWGDRPLILSAIEYGRLEEARALLAAGAIMPTRDEVEQALKDAWLRSEKTFRARALGTARALGFDVERSP